MSSRITAVTRPKCDSTIQNIMFGCSRASGTEVGMAAMKMAITIRPAAAQTATARNIARGADRRGSLVSSARSAEASQPISEKIGAVAANT